jgi:hypothetical protein
MDHMDVTPSIEDERALPGSAYELQAPDRGNPTFSRVACIADATSGGYAARRQAAALAEGGGAVKSIAATRRVGGDHETVLRLAGEADALVLGPGTALDSILTSTPIPVLLSRWLPVDAAIGDRILVVVKPAAEPTRVAEVAASLAARCDGEVHVLPSQPRDRALQRSLAATRRTVVAVTGSWPDLLGEEVVREAAVAAAVGEIGASLLVLPLGDAPEARAGAVSIARHVTCPVLAVPAGDYSLSRRAPHT